MLPVCSDFIGTYGVGTGVGTGTGVGVGTGVGSGVGFGVGGGGGGWGCFGVAGVGCCTGLSAFLSHAAKKKAVNAQEMAMRLFMSLDARRKFRAAE